MVTFPSEAATDPALVERWLARGMNMARINCAHDSADAWAAMVDNIRRAQTVTGRSCAIEMDLAGPKIRVEKTSFKKKHRFFRGDRLLLVRGKPQTSLEYPYQFGCTLQEAFDHAQVGTRSGSTTA